MTTVHVKVKSDPFQIQKHIENKVPKHIASGILRGEKHHPIVEQCLVFLNGGGGRVRREAVVGPLLDQLFLLAELRGTIFTNEQLRAVFERANLVTWSDYEKGLHLVVDRNFAGVMHTIVLCEEYWQDDIAGSTGSNVLERATATAEITESRELEPGIWILNPGLRETQLPLFPRLIQPEEAQNDGSEE